MEQAQRQSIPCALRCTLLHFIGAGAIHWLRCRKPGSGLTSMRMSRTRCPGMGSPVRLSTTSMRMGAPHLAFRTSPDRYFPAKVALQRLWGVCLQSSQWASRHPRLLEAHRLCHLTRQRALRRHQWPSVRPGAD